MYMEENTIENTKTMTVQLPEETYQRMKAYLKRYQFKQKDFVIKPLKAALESNSPDST